MKELTVDKNIKDTTRDFIGKRFGSLTVVSFVETNKYTTWHCKCDCGNEKNVYQHNLTSGRTTSCGCLKQKKAKEISKENLHIYKGIQIEKAMAKTTPRNNTSGFRGVILEKKTGKYRVRMILQGVRYELGRYSDFEEAKEARLAAEEMRDAIVEEYMRENRREKN